jgi:hypothetical protein
MGPYPHNAPRAVISDENPMGTDGFEFVEYASTEPEKLHELFRTMGFTAVAKHRSRDVTLYTGRAMSTSSSMLSPTASPGASPSSTAPARAPWRSASPMRSTPSSAP